MPCTSGYKPLLSQALASGYLLNAVVCVCVQLLDALYEQDVLEEDAVLQWAQEKEHADEEDKVFLRKAEEFIQWLQEAEEESGEDDDDE